MALSEGEGGRGPLCLKGLVVQARQARQRLGNGAAVVGYEGRRVALEAKVRQGSTAHDVSELLQ